MEISRQKKKENIAEYLLYMWQVEDQLRAADFDIERIDADIISRYNIDDEKRKEYHKWYESLIDMSLSEGIRQSGHLQINRNVISELEDLNRSLLKSSKFEEYSEEFYKILPMIVELRAKAGNEKCGEVETCFNALYGVLMLRLQGKEITAGTQMAIASISHFIAMLARYYHKNEEKPLFDDDIIEEI